LRSWREASGFGVLAAMKVPAPRPAGGEIVLPSIAGNGKKPTLNFALLV
jgi:hypothetical protein